MDAVLLATGYKDDPFEVLHRSRLLLSIEEIFDHVPVDFCVFLLALLVDPGCEEDIFPGNVLQIFGHVIG